MRIGERRLKPVLRRRRRKARTDRPQPYDADWGWWVEERLARISTQLKVLIGLAITTLTTEAVRINLANLHTDP